MLQIAEIFQNSMILQREKAICVWGKADIGSGITVAVQNQTVGAVTDKNGNWKVTLEPLKTSFYETLTVSDGTQQLVFEDVAIGEVWVGGGQSNMEFHMAYEKHFGDEKEVCQDEYLRFYDVPEIAYEGQREQFDYSEMGIWRKSTPSDLAYFSAVGYYFARELRKTLDVPVAVIGCNWGGTSITAWLSRPSLERVGKSLLQDFEKQMEGEDLDAYWKRQLTNPENNRGNLLNDAFFNFIMPRTVTLEEVNTFLGLQDKSWAGDMDVRPEAFPSVLYEHMVKKIIPFGIKGVLWYQGENDHTDNARGIYDQLLTAYITEWREFFNDARLPFLVVQLPGFDNWIGLPNLGYHVVREKQRQVADTVPNVWLCSISDSGEKYDVHPKDKRVVGSRLALLARGHMYGEDILCDAPVAKSISFQSGQVQIIFDHAGEGVFIRGEKLEALEMKKEEKRIPFSAQVRGNVLILVPMEEVEGKLSVEFAQGKWFLVNLYNSAGIPAIPFVFEITL